MTLRSAFLASLLLCTPLFAQTGVPEGISYQASITDEAGAVIAPLPGSAIPYNITLRIYDAATGGAQKWAEVFNGVPVSNGRFSVVLGQGIQDGSFANEGDLAEVFDEEDRFVEITVAPSAGGASKTFSPRQQFLASPTAFRAKVAEVAEGVTEGSVPRAAMAPGTGLQMLPNTAKPEVQLPSPGADSSNAAAVVSTYSLPEAEYGLPEKGVNGVYMIVRIFPSSPGAIILPDEDQFVPVSAEESGTNTPAFYNSVNTLFMASGIGVWNERVFCPIEKVPGTTRDYRFNYVSTKAHTWEWAIQGVTFRILGYY